MYQNMLFSPSYKTCVFCHRTMPITYEPDCCPDCIENELFSRVKDFIRDNDVNEYQVAYEFDIPVKQIKEWIKQGRIEYKENEDGRTIVNIHCQNCGDPVVFGTLCPKCLRLVNSNMHGYNIKEKLENSKMRFLDEMQKNIKGK